MEFRILIALLLGLCLFFSCEKEIDIAIPVEEGKVVVEGFIENGQAPLVILSKSQPFFSAVDVNSVAQSLITDADIKMIVENRDTIPLIRLCSSQLPDSLRERFAQQSGLSILASEDANFCIYTSLDERALGQINKNYRLRIQVDGQTIEAETRIPTPIPLDSLWYKKDASRDSLGFVWARLSDPAGKYNAYRWFAQRISTYEYGENKGELKDPFFIAPFGSAFEDEFFDGLSFDFAYNRGQIPGSQKEDDNGLESGYFKEGDSIAVKFTTIDQAAFKYWRTYYTAIGNTGSPFASPANVKSNITNGLGVWVGYGVSIDTLVAKDLD